VTGRELAVCLFAALTVACPAGVAAAFKAEPRGSALAIPFLGAGFVCGLYALLGWGWYVYTAVFR